jgi:hypothetical protein
MLFRASNVWRRISRFFGSNPRPTQEQLEYTDLAIVEPICMEHQERLLVDDGTFVGATGTFVSDRVVQTGAKLPTGYVLGLIVWLNFQVRP